jgi:hypothetical protein
MGRIMSGVASGKLRSGLLAAALAMSMLPSAGYGYTAEEEQACSGDAFRLCGSEIPDVERVTACMIQKKSELSPPCRVFFGPDPEPPSVAGAPLSIKPAAAPKSVKMRPRRLKKPARPEST